MSVGYEFPDKVEPSSFLPHEIEDEDLRWRRVPQHTPDSAGTLIKRSTQLGVGALGLGCALLAGMWFFS